MIFFFSKKGKSAPVTCYNYFQILDRRSIRPWTKLTKMKNVKRIKPNTVTPKPCYITKLWIFWTEPKVLQPECLCFNKRMVLTEEHKCQQSTCLHKWTKVHWKLRSEREKFWMYLCIISNPPDIGDCSHLAGPQNSSQVHFFIPHCHKGSWEMDILQLTCVGTHHWMNSIYCITMHEKSKKVRTFSFEMKKQNRERSLWDGPSWGKEGFMSFFKILSCVGTVGCHLCVIVHLWHSCACGDSICMAGTQDWQIARASTLPDQ